MTVATPQDDEIRILDERGCLTQEALCFTEQLLPEHLAVVQRHVRDCPLCAQQQLELARIAERVRGARPRVPVPTEVRTLARTVALRSLALRRSRPRKPAGQRSTARLRSVSRVVREPWYRSRIFWSAMVIVCASSLVLMALILLLL